MNRNLFVLTILLICYQSIDASRWKIPLKLQVIPETGKEFPHDKVYYLNAKFAKSESQKELKTIFTLDNHRTWVLKEDAATPAQNDPFRCGTGCNAASTSTETTTTTPPIVTQKSLMGDRLTDDADIKTYGLNEVQFGGKTFDQSVIYFPKIKAEKSDTLNLNSIRAGLGLAPSSHRIKETLDESVVRSNFLDSILKNAAEVKENKFSFYIHPKIPQVIFGQEENYFAKGGYTDFQNTATSISKWELDLQDIVVGNGLSAGLTNNPKAIFDMSTQFIWGPIDGLFNQIKSYNTGNCKYELVGGVASDVIYCDCDQVSTFPDIEFQFKTDTKKFKLTKDKYVVKKGSKCQLLFRKILASKYSFDQNSFYLGSAFFDQFYVVFDQTRQSINIAEKFDVPLQPLAIDDKTRVPIIVFGLILILVSLLLLLALFKKVIVPELPVIEVVQQPVYITTNPVIYGQSQIRYQ